MIRPTRPETSSSGVRSSKEVEEERGLPATRPRGGGNQEDLLGIDQSWGWDGQRPYRPILSGRGGWGNVGVGDDPCLNKRTLGHHEAADDGPKRRHPPTRLPQNHRPPTLSARSITATGLP